ncbi:MAG TPA: GNAT family protein [Pseudonocardiaceae bacterium]|jgi:RimJ/RimL family protein N-acetyltransferase
MSQGLHEFFWHDAHVVRLPGRLITLRDWSVDDLPPLRHWLAPEQPWHDTDGPYFGRPTPRDVAGQLSRFTALATIPEDVLPNPRDSLAIAATGSDRLLGQVNWYWEDQHTDWRRMGLAIYDEAEWGHGNGSEALKLWTSYLFDTTDALRLDFATYSGNPGMIAIGHKLGFTQEAVFRQARRWPGGVHDAIVFGVLRTEWAN